MTQDHSKATSKPKLNFISDEAADTDEFGSHSQIATALASVIQSHGKMRVIGLLGPWGSGKSTVINLTRKLLGASGDAGTSYRLFTYDAWLHQSDPPRRAFLEGLIDFLVDEKLVSEGQWASQLSRLNRQTEETESTTTPTLSVTGRWLLVPLFFLPIGFKLTDRAWLQAMSAPKAPWWDLVAFPLGVALIALPFAVAAGLWASWRNIRNPINWRFWAWKNLRSRRPEHQDESLISIFANRHKQTQRNTTTKNPEPTAIEFQSIFRSIIDDANNKNPTLKLIIVIDNIDRIPENTAIDIWATIRSFFLGKANNSRLPTVILPIDDLAIQRMYSNQHNTDASQRLAASFMDKTFDLTFHVTRPVLSDWQAYLAKQVANVFGELADPNWASTIGSIFDQKLILSNDHSIATPRSINRIVNEIGLLWLQWRDFEISIASISYYVINRIKADSDILKFVLGKNGALTALDPNWPQSVAALHYGVPVEQAAQILIEAPMREAIDRRDAPAFTLLEEKPGFRQVLDRIIQSGIGGLSSISPRDIIVVFTSCKLAEEPHSKPIWQQLRAHYLTTDMPDGIGATDVLASRSLCKHCAADEIDRLTSDLVDHISRLDEARFGAKGTTQAYFGIAELAFSHRRRHELPDLEPYFDGTAAAATTLLSLSRNQPDLVRSYALKIESGELVSQIMTSMTEPNPSLVEGAIVGLLYRAEPVTWAPAIGTAAETLRSGHAARSHAAAIALALLFETQKAAKATVSELVQEEVLIARLHEAMDAERTEAAAWIATLLLIGPSPATLLPSQGRNWKNYLAESPHFSGHLSHCLQRLGASVSLVTLSTISSQNKALTPLVAQAITHLLDDNALSVPSAPEVVTNYGLYYHSLKSEDDIRFLEMFTDDESFWNSLDKLSIYDAATILENLIIDEIATHDRARTISHDKLKSVSKDDWLLAIKEGGEPHDFAQKLAEIAGPLKLSGALFDGLRDAIVMLVDEADFAFRERWFALSMQLTQSNRRTLLRSLGDHLSRQVRSVRPLEILSLSNNLLLREGDLGRSGDDFARNVLLTLLQDPSALQWSLENGEQLAKVLAGASADTLGTVFEKLDGLSGEDDIVTADAAKSLRATWGDVPSKR